MVKKYNKTRKLHTGVVDEVEIVNSEDLVDSIPVDADSIESFEPPADMEEKEISSERKFKSQFVYKVTGDCRSVIVNGVTFYKGDIVTEGPIPEFFLANGHVSLVKS